MNLTNANKIHALMYEDRCICIRLHRAISMRAPVRGAHRWHQAEIERRPLRHCATFHYRDNFNLDSTRQAGQVTSKERNTGEHGELQADAGQQGLETPPHKLEPGPPAGLREGLARAQGSEAGGPKGRPREPLPAERVGCAVDAPPRRTPAVGARRASATGREEPEAATGVGRRRGAPRPVLRASESRRCGEQWTSCQSECESPTLPPGSGHGPGGAGQGKEEGTQEIRPQERWRKGRHPEVGQKGTPGQSGHEES